MSLLLDQSAIAKMLAAMSGGANLPTDGTYGPTQGAMPTPSSQPSSMRGTRPGGMPAPPTQPPLAAPAPEPMNMLNPPPAPLQKGGAVRSLLGGDAMPAGYENLFSASDLQKAKPSLRSLIANWVLGSSGQDLIKQNLDAMGQGRTLAMDREKMRAAEALRADLGKRYTDPAEYVTQLIRHGLADPKDLAPLLMAQKERTFAPPSPTIPDGSWVPDGAGGYKQLGGKKSSVTWRALTAPDAEGNFVQESSDGQIRSANIKMGQKATAAGGGSLGMGNVEQSKSLGFARRMLASDRILRAKEEGGKPTVGVQATKKLPFVGDALSNAMSTEDQQSYDTAFQEFGSAQMRKESGAQINKDEWVQADKRYRRILFDKNSTIKQKQDARLLALKVMAKAAGPAWTAEDQADLKSYLSELEGKVETRKQMWDRLVSEGMSEEKATQEVLRLKPNG